MSAFLDLQNLFPWGSSPLCIIFWSVKFTYFHAKDDTFKPANIEIFFLQNIFVIPNMFCFQFDTNLAPIPWTKYFEESFEAFFVLHLLSNISTKFRTFRLVVFLLIKFIVQIFNHWFDFWFEVFFFV